jgi:hypothetical protein
MAVDQNIVGLPNDLSPDMQLGERTYFARQTYYYIQKHIPEQDIIQNNPAHILDRPSGLYGNHQMAIADRTAYGISQENFDVLRNGVSEIFQMQSTSAWEAIDPLCRQYSINYIIVGDLDPIWSSIRSLSAQRAPVYKNPYYTVFNCGN